MPTAPGARSPSSAEPSARLGSRAILAGAALGLAAVPLALTLLLVVSRSAPLLRADRGARDSMYSFAVAHDGFVVAMQVISAAGSVSVWLVLLAVVVGWLLWRRMPRLALFAVITAAGSSLLNAVVKTAVHRLRPSFADPVAQEQGLSFPSGHAQSATVGYAVLLLVFLPILHGAWRRAAVAFAVLMILAIGFSRVALGVHYLSDVMGGFVLGAAWVTAMAAAFDAMHADSGRREV